MTAQQLAAVKTLARYAKSGLEFTEVEHGHPDPPRGWVRVVVHEPYVVGEDGVYHRDSPIKSIAHVSPTGGVRTMRVP